MSLASNTVTTPATSLTQVDSGKSKLAGQACSAQSRRVHHRTQTAQTRRLERRRRRGRFRIHPNQASTAPSPEPVIVQARARSVGGSRGNCVAKCGVRETQVRVLLRRLATFARNRCTEDRARRVVRDRRRLRVPRARVEMQRAARTRGDASAPRRRLHWLPRVGDRSHAVSGARRGRSRRRAHRVRTDARRAARESAHPHPRWVGLALRAKSGCRRLRRRCARCRHRSHSSRRARASQTSSHLRALGPSRTIDRRRGASERRSTNRRRRRFLRS